MDVRVDSELLAGQPDHKHRTFVQRTSSLNSRLERKRKEEGERESECVYICERGGARGPWWTSLLTVSVCERASEIHKSDREIMRARGLSLSRARERERETERQSARERACEREIATGTWWTSLLTVSFSPDVPMFTCESIAIEALRGLVSSLFTCKEIGIETTFNTNPLAGE